MGALDKVAHVVVLMLENRSFDSMLGQLYPKSDWFDGLSGTESNPDLQGNEVRVWTAAGTDEIAMSVPDRDPGELWTDVNTQLFGTATVADPASVPTMSGFVRNYQSQSGKSPGTYDPKNVMHYYSPEQVPVISRLARQFAVSDRWYAAAPCQTWPNRFFLHTGTANGFENNSPLHFPYDMPTIFNRFDDLGIANGWKIYFHDLPQTMTLSGLWRNLDGFRFYEEFRNDARQGTLPCYSFIEPRYFSDVSLPNDQHPPHVVTLGEQLIADVYNSVRKGPAWPETLLIITYDEHGGCYDHVPPPPAIPPSAIPTQPFNFDRYGVRVPAIIVSPYIRQGTVLRAPGGVPFDHTSILSTLRNRFNLGAPLSNRDAAAPDLASALILQNPDNSGPDHLDALPYAASPSDLAQAKNIPINNLQKSLLDLATRIPQDANSVDAHITALRAAALETENKVRDVADAVEVDLSQAIAEARSLLGKLFGSL